MNPFVSHCAPQRRSQIASAVAHRIARPLLWAGSIVALGAGLAACGGGGSSAEAAAAESSSASLTATSSLDLDTATSLAANGAQAGTDVPALVDASVASAMTLNLAAPASASATQDGLRTAQSVQPLATVTAAGAPTGITVPLPCAVAGQATLTLSGAPLAQLLNGQLDAGEVYDLHFDACQTAAGQPVFNGHLTLTVQAATSTGHTLTWTASGLSGTVPLGQVVLDGTATHASSDSLAGDGATLRQSQLTAPSLALQSTYNSHGRRSTLSALSLTRSSRWVNGTVASAQLSGSTQVMLQRATGSDSFSLAIQGQVNVGSDGLPSTGEWLLVLPGSSVDLRLDGSSAVINVDQGKDGSVDRTVTLPLQRLQSSAG